jgi:hypothetical protein
VQFCPNSSKHIQTHLFYGWIQRLWSRDSWVNIEMGCWLDGRVSIPGSGKRFYSTPQRPDRLWAHPSTSPMGTGGSFPGGKAAGREADHSPLSSAEVKNGGAVPPLPHTSSWHGA